MVLATWYMDEMANGQQQQQLMGHTRGAAGREVVRLVCHIG